MKTEASSINKKPAGVVQQTNLTSPFLIGEKSKMDVALCRQQ